MSKKTISFETYGCALNKADTEYMIGQLQQKGYIIAKKGDIHVINTCTVKTPTENRMHKRLRELAKTNQKIIITGCMSAADPRIPRKYPQHNIIGTNIQDISTAVKKTLKNMRYVKIREQKLKLTQPKQRLNKHIEIIPIATGCAGNCSYCLTKKARGNLHSQPAQDIINQAHNALNEDVKEIWLTAQDTGAWGLEYNTTLPQLLNELTKIEGDYKIRVGMMNPHHAHQILDELIESMQDKKIYSFLHLPVQSGDNRVLKAMNRQYNINQFKKIVQEIRKKLIKPTIATDIIAGYPSETKQEYNNTIQLIKELKPEVLNISRFWLRPHTKAQEQKQHPTRITKDRSRIITKIFQNIAYQKNQQWIGWCGNVLVCEKGKLGSYVGRNQSYKPIILKTQKNLLGKQVKAKITNATYYDLRATIYPK